MFICGERFGQLVSESCLTIVQHEYRTVRANVKPHRLLLHLEFSLAQDEIQNGNDIEYKYVLFFLLYPKRQNRISSFSIVPLLSILHFLWHTAVWSLTVIGKTQNVKLRRLWNMSFYAEKDKVVLAQPKEKCNFAVDMVSIQHKTGIPGRELGGNVEVRRFCIEQVTQIKFKILFIYLSLLLCHRRLLPCNCVNWGAVQASGWCIIWLRGRS